MAKITNAAENQRPKSRISSPEPLEHVALDTKIPEPLYSALVAEGYSGTDLLREFAANAVSAQQIFRFFASQTPQKPWLMINELMTENLRLKRELVYVRRHGDLFAKIYDKHVAQWFKLKDWLTTKKLIIPTDIEQMGQEARFDLLRFEGLIPKQPTK